MEGYIYVASDGSMMTIDDVISMLKYCLNTEVYKKWSFDEITGGEMEFVSHEHYTKAKYIFEKIKK